VEGRWSPKPSNQRRFDTPGSRISPVAQPRKGSNLSEVIEATIEATTNGAADPAGLPAPVLPEEEAVEESSESEALKRLDALLVSGDDPAALIGLARRERALTTTALASERPLASLVIAIRGFEQAEDNLRRALARMHHPTSPGVLAIQKEMTRGVVQEWLPALEKVFMLLPDLVRSRLGACWAAEVAKNTALTRAAILVTVVHTTLPVADQNPWNTPPPHWYVDEAGGLAGVDDTLLENVFAVRSMPGSFTVLEFGQRSPSPPTGQEQWIWLPGEQVFV